MIVKKEIMGVAMQRTIMTMCHEIKRINNLPLYLTTVCPEKKVLNFLIIIFFSSLFSGSRYPGFISTISFIIFTDDQFYDRPIKSCCGNSLQLKSRTTELFAVIGINSGSEYLYILKPHEMWFTGFKIFDSYRCLKL